MIRGMAKFCGDVLLALSGEPSRSAMERDRDLLLEAVGQARKAHDIDIEAYQEAIAPVCATLGLPKMSGPGIVAEALAGRITPLGQTRLGVATIVRKQCGDMLWGLRTSEHGAGTWAIPGGAVEPREHPLKAALRELEEETGITATEATSLPMFTYNADNEPQPPWVTLYYLVEVPDDTVALVMEPTKCAEWVWHKRSDMPAPLFGPSRALLSTGINPWNVEVVKEDGMAVARNLNPWQCANEANIAASRLITATDLLADANLALSAKPTDRKRREAAAAANSQLRAATVEKDRADARLQRAGGIPMGTTST